jgi:putative transposase
MIRLLWAAVAAAVSGFRSQGGLMIENLALRQQLSTVLQKRRPRIGLVDRAFWVLRRVWRRWSETIVIVKPETVIGWHRAGFALYWRWLSRRRRSPGRASVGRKVRELVRRMARENGWGAPRIHGELLKLGFRVSERTVSRHMRRHERSPERRQSWLTFLRNHREVIVAMDFFTVPTATFRVLYVWFAIKHSRREIVHWCVADHPTATWVVQQLRETYPFDDAGARSKYLVHDRDTIFSAAVISAIESLGLRAKRTSYQSPWQNGVAERFVGTVRRELLGHAIVLASTAAHQGRQGPVRLLEVRKDGILQGAGLGAIGRAQLEGLLDDEMGSVVQLEPHPFQMAEKPPSTDTSTGVG